MKWLTHIRVSESDMVGPFTQAGYRPRPRRPVTPGTLVSAADTVPVRELPVKSLITSVAHDAAVALGMVRIAGFAWVGDAEVRRVDVSVTRQRADVAGDAARAGLGAVCVAPVPGLVAATRDRYPYAVLSRATDSRGRVPALFRRRVESRGLPVECG